MKVLSAFGLLGWWISAHTVVLGFLPAPKLRMSAWILPCRVNTILFVTDEHESNSSVEDNYYGSTSDDSCTSFSAELDPYSSVAHSIICGTLRLTEEQLKQLQALTEAVCEWNTKINLVSRKDCNPATVFARHVVPSLAYDCATEQQGHHVFRQQMCRVMDVGTGGGFPGLPLAIQFPETEFVLADSIGKKIAVCSDIAQQLHLTNVRTYHGRVEAYLSEQFDVVTGRGVTSIPNFCATVQHLLRNNNSHVVYWTGGDIEKDVIDVALQNTSIQHRIPEWDDNYDKRILVWDAATVRTLGGNTNRSIPKGITNNGRNPNRSKTNVSKTSPQRKNKIPKGAWKKRDDSRQRGYENFQRYSSMTSTPSTKGED